MPLPLGGLNGLATLLSTIRDIPEFSKVPKFNTSVQKGENILISTVDFADDVSFAKKSHFTMKQNITLNYIFRKTNN